MTTNGAFDSILGQRSAIETLVHALRSGRVHHAYRFEGPDGVGKELAAFALAQALLCDGNAPLGCGDCSACRRAVKLSNEDPRVPQHPDVLVVGRGVYPPSALGTQSRETVAIGVEQVRRVVLSRIGFPPHEGRALVVIVRAAHELSQQAANALLKTLEEPPDRVHFVLITSQPNRLLDTIRSRTLAVRFAPLPERVLAAILERHGKSTSVSRLAGGSASAALALADDDRARARSEFVRSADEAIGAPGVDAALAFAGSRPDDRDALLEQLRHLAQHYALGARDMVSDRPRDADVLAARHAVVTNAIDAVERNAQPALVLESMVVRLRSI
jgi:DNA polymerase-3 subunit delta'